MSAVLTHKTENLQSWKFPKCLRPYARHYGAR